MFLPFFLKVENSESDRPPRQFIFVREVVIV